MINILNNVFRNVVLMKYLSNKIMGHKEFRCFFLAGHIFIFVQPKDICAWRTHIRYESYFFIESFSN